jgi:heat shock protein HtpX
MGNTVKTTALLAGLTGLFLVVGFLIGGRFGMFLAFGLAVLMNMGAWWFSDSIALRMNGAEEVSPAEQPELHKMVANLADRAGLPMPRVYIIHSPMPNAFATGRSPSKGAVAVTTGIMQMLSSDELAGVVAHELAHIKNRDTLISSIAATVGGAITMLADMAMWSMIFGGLTGGDDDDGGGIGEMVSGILMMVLAPLAAMVIQMAISRSREYGADKRGAEIMGNPLPLANALAKLEQASGRVATQVNPATSHLYIVNPLHGGLAGLFSTHPATEERIRRLRDMAQTTGYTAQAL